MFPHKDGTKESLKERKELRICEVSDERIQKSAELIRSEIRTVQATGPKKAEE